MDEATNIVIRTGGDPRHLAAFEEIRQEINKINHPQQPEVNWQVIETRALLLFRTNGVDLQTAVYYGIARQRLAGLAGFTEGCELLAGLMTTAWSQCWPDNETARIEILEWFNVKSGSALRQLSLVEKDLRLLYRAERALQLICDKLQQVPLKKLPRIENLLIFIQNNVRRVEQIKQQGRSTVQQTPTETLVWIAGRADPDVTVATPPALTAPASHASVSVPPTGSSKLRWRLEGVLAGLFCSLIVIACSGYFYVLPLQNRLARLAQYPEVASMLWLETPDITRYGEQLARLKNRLPFLPLALAERSVALAQQRWPEDRRQQATTERWQAAWRAASEGSLKDGGYSQVRQQLDELSATLLRHEEARSGVTISYLKTAVYQMQRAMTEDIPLETLMKELEHQVQSGTPASAGLIKQINERWEFLSIHYYQLMNPSWIPLQQSYHAGQRGDY